MQSCARRSVFWSKGRDMKPSARVHSWKTVGKLIAGLVVWLALVAMTFYTLLVLPLVILVSAYLVYVITRLRTRDAKSAQRHGYYNED